MHALILFALVAVQTGRPLTPLPAPQYLDGETAARTAADQNLPSRSGFGFDIDFTGSDSNNLEVALGTDRDKDGELSEAETDVTVGWDCGHYFIDRRDIRRRFDYRALDKRAERKLSYRVGTRKTRATTFDLQTDEGAFGRMVDTKKAHTLRWVYTGADFYGCYVALRNFRYSDGISFPERPGLNPDPLAVAFGCPYLTLSSYKFGVGDGCVRCDYNGSTNGRLETTVLGDGYVTYDYDGVVVDGVFDIYADGVNVFHVSPKYGPSWRPGWTAYTNRFPVTYKQDTDWLTEDAERTITWRFQCGGSSGGIYELSDIVMTRATPGTLPAGAEHNAALAEALGYPQFPCWVAAGSHGGWSRDSGGGISVGPQYPYGIYDVSMRIKGPCDIKFYWRICQSGYPNSASIKFLVGESTQASINKQSFDGGSTCSYGTVSLKADGSVPPPHLSGRINGTPCASPRAVCRRPPSPARTTSTSRAVS